MKPNARATPPTKREKRLQTRRQDYDKMIAGGSKESKVATRMSAGGYRKPGSMNK